MYVPLQADSGIWKNIKGHHNHTPVGGEAAADGSIAHRQHPLVLDNRRGLVLSYRLSEAQMKVSFNDFLSCCLNQSQQICIFCNNEERLNVGLQRYLLQLLLSTLWALSFIPISLWQPSSLFIHFINCTKVLQFSFLPTVWLSYHLILQVSVTVFNYVQVARGS